MRAAFSIAFLELRARRKRLLALTTFAGLFLAAGLTARLLTDPASGQAAADQLFLIGGYPLVSALLLLGWLLGRFPLIATLVLMAGIVSDDETNGLGRLYAVRPVRPATIYGARFVILTTTAFLLSAILLPAFDLLLLGTWAGPATLVLILANVLVFGALITLLSTWTRGDAWIALGLAITSIIWNALRIADELPVPIGVRDFISLILPPQAALLRLEDAFGTLEPIPWDAFAYTTGYGSVLLLLAFLVLRRREL